MRSLDVAEYMGFSKPSVSRAVGLLKQGGYLLMDKDGYLTLTEGAEGTDMRAVLDGYISVGRVRNQVLKEKK